MDKISILSMVGAGGALAMIPMFWNNIKSLFSFFYSFFVVTINLDSDGRSFVHDYIIKSGKFKTSKFSALRVVTYYKYVREFGKRAHIPVAKFSSRVVVWYGIVPIILSNSSNKPGGPVSTGEDGESAANFCISYIRGTFDGVKLVKDAFRFYTNYYSNVENGRGRFFVNRFIGGYAENSNGSKKKIESEVSQRDSGEITAGKSLDWDKEDLNQCLVQNNFENLCFSKQIVESFDFIKRWYNSKEWYKERGIPWKIGLLLHGKPGTGKSSYVRSLGQEIDVPVFVFDIATMSNSEFSEFWREAQCFSPCICLIEDFDRVFDKDKNTVTADLMKQKLTLDCILNEISGVENGDGIVTIITANNADRIDESLGQIGTDGKVSRPGRIDMILEFDILEEGCRKTIAERMLKDSPEHIDRIVKEGDGDTGAQFVNRCSVFALNDYWKHKKQK